MTPPVCSASMSQGGVRGCPPSVPMEGVAWIDEFASPVGGLVAAAHGDSLILLHFAGTRWAARHLARLSATGVAMRHDPAHPLLRELRQQLDGYFGGTRRRFALPLLLRGTPFQRQVWAAVLRIPHAATVSYAHLAAAIGRPRAVRAVAGANAANPLAIVVPCHRVIAADGGLGGYAGGVSIKRRLLDLEAKRACTSC